MPDLTIIQKFVALPAELFRHRMKYCMNTAVAVKVCFPPVKNKAVTMSTADVLYILTIQPQLEPYRRRELLISSVSNTAGLHSFLCKQLILFVVWF